MMNLYGNVFGHRACFREAAYAVGSGKDPSVLSSSEPPESEPKSMSGTHAKPMCMYRYIFIDVRVSI